MLSNIFLDGSAGNILESLAKKSVEHEFYTPVPKGYKAGKTKYVCVFGTVMSGLGKGIFSSSLAKLMQIRNFKVAPTKFDGYLNQDAGTLNPYRHGEVFVLDDGTECDMDLGNYERFLDIDLSKNNYLTGGKIFNSVLSKEREGKYLGRDVQIIPHVTGEIKHFLRNLAVNSKADIVFIEVGGTVGDFENMYFIEALRELAYEEGKQNVCFIALTYILQPKNLVEQKSKAAQLGLKSLLNLGIQPDIVACRCSDPVDEKVKEKISLYSNVPISRVVSVHDCKTVYSIPLLLRDAGIDKEVLDILKINNSKEDAKKINELKNYIKNISHIKKQITIGITGKYVSVRDSYASIINAIEHAGNLLGVEVNIRWIETSDIEDGRKRVDEVLKDISGIIVPGGFGKRGMEGKIQCIKYARENKIPFLGLCLGFQMAVVDFARNLCKLKDANSTEICNTKYPVIDILPEQKNLKTLGGNMRLGSYPMIINRNSKLFRMYGKEKISERHRHRYEVNPEFIAMLEKKGLVFSAKSPDGKLMEFLELQNHPYFIATQAHAEYKSRPNRPAHVFMEFIRSCVEIKKINIQKAF